MRWVPVVAGFLLLTWGSLVFVFSYGSLAHVDVYWRSQISTTAPDRWWLWWVVSLTLGMALSVSPNDVDAKCDGTQLTGAIWLSLVAAPLLWLWSGDTNWMGPVYDECRYEGCWPRGFQEWALAVPVLSAVVVMVTMSLQPALSRRVRAFAPAATLLGMALIQLTVWDWLVRPVLFDSPPF